MLNPPRDMVGIWDMGIRVVAHGRVDKTIGRVVDHTRVVVARVRNHGKIHPVHHMGRVRTPHHIPIMGARDRPREVAKTGKARGIRVDQIKGAGVVESPISKGKVGTVGIPMLISLNRGAKE